MQHSSTDEGKQIGTRSTWAYSMQQQCCARVRLYVYRAAIKDLGDHWQNHKRQHGASACKNQNKTLERLAVLQIRRQQRLCKVEDTLDCDATYCDDLEDAH